VPKWIDRADVRRLVAANAQLVEVLPRDEWESEHITGARSIPLKELDERARSELDAGQTVIVYCYGFL
jgi:rhodanese-related sulfurtransferase